MNTKDLRLGKVRSLKFVYYLNIDAFPIELWSESTLTDHSSPGVFLDTYSTYIVQGGKVFSDKSIQELANFFSDVAKHAKCAIKIIAVGERLKEGVYLVFCPHLEYSAEIVKSELLEIFARAKEEISSGDTDILRLIANEMVCDLFYSSSVKSDLLDPKQWHGLLVVEESLKGELCSALLKLRKQEKAEVPPISTNERISKFYSKLEALGIGILSSLIATGIIQLIIRFVFSTPVGSPKLGRRKFEDNMVADFFKNDAGGFDSEKTVSSKEIAASLRMFESSVIPFMNSIPVLTQVDRSSRSYKLVGNDYFAPDASYTSHSVESLVSSGFLGSSILSYLCPTSAINFKYEVTSDVVDRPDDLGEMIEYSKSSQLALGDKDISKLVDIYTSL